MACWNELKRYHYNYSCLCSRFLCPFIYGTKAQRGNATIIICNVAFLSDSILIAYEWNFEVLFGLLCFGYFQSFYPNILFKFNNFVVKNQNICGSYMMFLLWWNSHINNLISLCSILTHVCAAAITLLQEV